MGINFARIKFCKFGKFWSIFQKLAPGKVNRKLLI